MNEDHHSTIRVIRHNLLTDKKTNYAGYSHTIGVYAAVQYLIHWAWEEAKQSRLTAISNHQQRFEFILSDEKQPVVRYYLEFPN